ncbi:MAG: dTMP kinase [bacterium]
MKRSMKGKFITFEGVEWCGKTTQMNMICHELDSRGKAYIRTREPGGTRIGEQIRKILMDPQNTDLSGMAELLLYIADRAQHVARRVLPALNQGMLVICDRFADATVAYQGDGRGLDRARILELNQIATGGLKPDLTLLIDIPAEIGLARARKRNKDKDIGHSEGRFEEEELDFHNRVRAGYLHLAELEPERFRVVDGSLSPEQTYRQVLSLMGPLL